MPEHIYDAAIIGGGPAGSTAAIFLAGLGFDVCLFEKKPFPREVLCGEFLSHEVFSIIREIGLEDEFIAARPNRINHFRLFDDSGINLNGDLNFTAYGLKRGTFDMMLLKEANEMGVTILQPAVVEAITLLDDYNSSYSIQFSSGNNTKTIKARKVIAAYGRQNILDKKLNRSFTNRKSQLNGVKFHVDEQFFKSFNKNEIHIYTSDAIYCGVNAVNNGFMTVCFLEKRKNPQQTPRGQILKLIENNKAFADLFNDDFVNEIDNMPIYGTGNIYFGKRNLIENGIYMTGDAGHVIAPLAGDGISMAMQSGRLAALIITDVLHGSISSGSAHKLYIDKWGDSFFKRIYTAKAIQNMLLNKRARKIGLSFIKLYPRMLGYFIELTRGKYKD